MEIGSGPALAHRSVANIRSAPSQGPAGPSSPHTPQRPINSTYGSPSTIRADDDIVVIQLGARFLRAGFAGDSCPKAVLSSGPNEQRRVGDFRAWQGSDGPTGHQAAYPWADDYELWRHELRGFDMGLFQDKLDRLLRDAFTRFLLIDSRPRRASLVLDSALPTPLLSAVLDTLFNRFQAPMVSLVSSSTMTAVAAGVRSALVVDMGWAETVVTSVYEYREVKSTRSVRGGKLLIDELYQALHRLVLGDAAEQTTRVASFEECEDIVNRLMWCRSSAYKSSQRQSAQLETVQEQDETEAETQPASQSKKSTKVPIKSTNPPPEVEIPFEKLADVCDTTYFPPSTEPSTFDDHELPAHLLVYQHLLQLPMDVRAVCMSRIIFTGGCSNILGVRERIIDEVMSIVDRTGWEAVTGKVAEEVRRNIQQRRTAGATQTAEIPVPVVDSVDDDASSQGDAPGNESQLDPIEAKLARGRQTEPQMQGQIRAVHSLGPWAGASLLSQLKVPAMATIDRELWLQQGATGASRPSDVDVKAQQRQSMGAGGLIRGSGGHHTNWTLGTWGAL